MMVGERSWLEEQMTGEDDDEELLEELEEVLLRTVLQREDIRSGWEE